MNKKILALPQHLLLLSLLFFAALCTQCRRKEVKPIQRDVTITSKNAVTRLLVDSLQMEAFITTQKLEDSSATRLRNFYNSRNFQFAWVAEHGLAEQAKVFYDLDKNYITSSRDSTTEDQSLHKRLGEILSKDTIISKVSPALITLELSLTQHFFQFVNTAYGGKLDPAALQWYIPRKKLDAVALLDSLVAKKGQSLEQWEPVNSYYKTLNKELLRWYAIRQDAPWATLKAGETAAIKVRLIQFGDLPASDTTSAITPAFSEAVKKAQQQFGLIPTGKVNRSLLNALNVPAEARIRQMLINLERMRWAPLFPEGRVILVNIPEYKLHVFENRQEAFNMGIVVGKAANKTVIFSNSLKNIVFSPYWNIPPSIVKAEILPAMRSNKNYLAQKNMEQYGTSEGLPLIRQKPGNDNSLGRVKFLFPNSYNIYLHDTPAKSLFAEEKRAFSHGCIRLAAPQKLAAYLLSDQPQWTTEKISQAMNLKTEKWVTMKTPVPVFITYFTCWVDKNGSLNFRDDLYGHDQEMAKQLF